MEKAYAKFGAWRASARGTRLKEVKVATKDKKSRKKKNKKMKKRAASPKIFFFCSDGDTLTRTSEPSQREPRLDLWTTDRPRFGLDPCHSLL